MSFKINVQAAVLTAVGAVLFAPAAPPVGAQTTAGRYEVWIVDQSDTAPKHGGSVSIFAGADLDAANPSGAKPVQVIDLAGPVSAMCLERTGANPIRPHMLLFNRTNTHALLAFVASGHVVVFNAATREPIDCLRTSQAASGQQAHAAFPTPDGSYVLVANQNGKRLERIDTDYTAGRFAMNPAATLDLAACTTPSGAACQAPDIRPDNAPICPIISTAGDLAFVTLRGGGMLVVDPRPTPMRIVAEYDMKTVKGNGCGGVQVGNQMYVNSGGRPGVMDHLDVYGFDVYRFGLESFNSARPSTAPNAPAPTVVFSADGQHDSHGMVATGGGAYVWVADRHADVIEVIATTDNSRVGTIALNGALTTNAAPDLMDISPSGNRAFIAFRGPTPLSGDPHNATGTTPGLAVIEVGQNGRAGAVVGLIRLTNMGSDGVERADPHAVRVRPLN